MREPGPLPAAPEDRLAEAVTAFLQAAESGGEPDRGAILAGHPDLADQLQEFFEAHDQINRFASPFLSADADFADGMPLNGRGRPRREPQPREFGDFELAEEIGRGGMGVVFKARQKSLNRVVALKRVIAGPWAARADLQRFRNEAEAAARLDHPNIVPVYEVGEHRGHPYFSMRLMEGGSLADRPGRYADDPRGAARLTAMLARAVHHAHRRGVLHRDLKPSNILLDAEGRPAVSDFGLARSIEGGGELTLTGTVLGSPSYMAPEQAAGRKGEITVATDVYGLGAVLYALLTGEPPFRGDSALETLDRVRATAPAPPDSCNDRVERDLATVCLKCLEKDPSRRYHSAEALADDLDRWLDRRPILARPVGRAERAWRWCRRNPQVAGLSATVAALLIGSIASLAVALAAVDREWRATRSALDTTRSGREAARESEAIAQAQRRRAESNLIKALDVTNRLLLQGDAENPGRRTGLTAIQRRRADEALRFYLGLLDEVKSDPSSRLEEGTIYCYLANVHRQRRDVAGVKEAYGRAADSYRTRAAADPSSWECWAHLGQACNMLGQALVELGRAEESEGPFREASAAYQRAEKAAPTSHAALNYLAWFLASCPDERLRDPARAVELADRALRLAPRAGNVWNTLGVAQYRAGRWADCIAALGRSMELGSGGDGIDWFFLAMAHARRGDREQAKAWYDRAGEWMDRNNSLDGELGRLREEARVLLGLQGSLQNSPERGGTRD